MWGDVNSGLWCAQALLPQLLEDGKGSREPPWGLSLTVKWVSKGLPWPASLLCFPASLVASNSSFLWPFPLRKNSPVSESGHLLFLKCASPPSPHGQALEQSLGLEWGFPTPPQWMLLNCELWIHCGKEVTCLKDRITKGSQEPLHKWPHPCEQQWTRSYGSLWKKDLSDSNWVLAVKVKT